MRVRVLAGRTVARHYGSGLYEGAWHVHGGLLGRGGQCHCPLPGDVRGVPAHIIRIRGRGRCAAMCRDALRVEPSDIHDIYISITVLVIVGVTRDDALACVPS